MEEDGGPKSQLERRYIEKLSQFFYRLEREGDTRKDLSAKSELDRMQATIGENRSRQLRNWYRKQDHLVPLIYRGEDCDILDVSVPEIFWDMVRADHPPDDRTIAEIKGEIVAIQLQVAGTLTQQCGAFGMAQPLIWSWIDSQGKCVWRMQFHGLDQHPTVPSSDTAAEFDASAYFAAWLDAAMGKAPIYVKLEDSLGKTKTFRVQFGEPRTE